MAILDQHNNSNSFELLMIHYRHQMNVKREFFNVSGNSIFTEFFLGLWDLTAVDHVDILFEFPSDPQIKSLLFETTIIRFLTALAGI